MIYFHYPSIIRAVRFESFVILSRHAYVTHGAISHFFADGFAVQLVCLMFFETRAASKVSVANLTRYSFFGVRTRWKRLAVTKRLAVLLRHATSTLYYSLYIILSRHRTRKFVYHVIIFLYVVIQQVNSFFGF